MSYHFTCVVAHGISADDESCLNRRHEELRPDCWVLWNPDAPRGWDIDTDRALARDLSVRFGRALLVLYDDSSGIRQAEMYADENLAASYGEQNEIWVPVDDKGYPVADGKHLTVEELRDDFEYDCIRNGIDVALDELLGESVVSSNQLRQAVCHPES